MIANSADAHQLNVAIVGGGIGGLCLAIGLLKYPHINVQIYEGAQAFAEIGAGLTVGPNARRALKLIDSSAEQAFHRSATGNGPHFPELKNVYCRYIRGAGPKCGEVIGDTWCDDGQQSVHRAKFLNGLIHRVPQEIAHFMKRLTSLDEANNGRVTLKFEDGTTASADCVIGADGVHSVVRKHLLPPDHPAYNPEFAHARAYRGLLPLEEVRALLGDEVTEIAQLQCAKGGLIMTYPVESHTLFNIVAVDTEVDEWTGPTVQPANLDEMRQKFAHWGPLARRLVSLLDKPETKMWSLWQIPSIPTFIQSRVVVMGDAAHATTPYQGQGAGQAIEDALVLSNLLGKVENACDLNYAFKAYDRIRRPRSQKSVKTSFEAGELFSMRLPGVLDDGQAFKQNIEDRYDWAFNRDMQLQVDQALLMVEEMKVTDAQTEKISN